MELFLFTNSKPVQLSFSTLSRQKGITLTVFPAADLKKKLKGIPDGSLVYLDIGSVPKNEFSKATALLLSQKSVRACFVDPKGSVADIAALFHGGAADYIGKDLAKTKYNPKRIKSVTDFSSILESEAPAGNKAKGKIIPSGNDWKLIKQGKEYTFFFMFVELDRKDELKQSHFGAGQNKTPAELFKNFVERYVTPANGRIWMWMGHTGLVLFPFDGERCDPLVTALRLHFNRHIYCIEESIINAVMSFRVAIHIGNTVYKKRGETGTIVSDAINSVFHLGQKFTDPGSISITEDVIPHLPEWANEFLVEAGEYEGRKIHKMKRPK